MFLGASGEVGEARCGHRSFPSAPSLPSLVCVRVFRPGPLWPFHIRGLGRAWVLLRGQRMEAPAFEEGSLWTGPLFLCLSP